MSKLQKRINGMNQEQYAYHFENQGDDPALSCNPFRLLHLVQRFFCATITPREEEELVNNAYYIRQCLEGLFKRGCRA